MLSNKPSLNQHRRLERFGSMKDSICLAINLSTTFDSADNTLIGRKFFLTVSSPLFLKIGETSAFFSLFGKSPDSSISLAISATSLKQRAEVIFKILTGTSPLTVLELSW